MRKGEHVSSVKNELLDIFMSLKESEHKRRKKSAAMRYLRARRGIELHNEFKRLERDIAGLDDELMQ